MLNFIGSAAELRGIALLREIFLYAQVNTQVNVLCLIKCYHLPSSACKVYKAYCASAES